MNRFMSVMKDRLQEDLKGAKSWETFIRTYMGFAHLYNSLEI